MTDTTTDSDQTRALRQAMVIALVNDGALTDGHRVLQVATGTGYTAALLCARLGSERVTSGDQH